MGCSRRANALLEPLLEIVDYPKGELLEHRIVGRVGADEGAVGAEGLDFRFRHTMLPVGRLDRGLKQMMDQVNLSRLSHGVRAAGMPMGWIE